jgi:hypothetical protein
MSAKFLAQCKKWHWKLICQHVPDVHHFVFAVTTKDNSIPRYVNSNHTDSQICQLHSIFEAKNGIYTRYSKTTPQKGQEEQQSLEFLPFWRPPPLRISHDLLGLGVLVHRNGKRDRTERTALHSFGELLSRVHVDEEHPLGRPRNFGRMSDQTSQYSQDQN